MSLALLRRVQDALVEATAPMRAAEEAGAFLLLLTPHDPLVWLNYAVPLRPPGEEDVEAMVAAFRRRDRMPRLEFARELWPALPDLLERHGFQLDGEQPAMNLPASDWRPTPHGHAVRLAAPSDAVRLHEVVGAAFGQGPPSEESFRSTAVNLENGRLLGALVELDGTAISAGFAVGDSCIREVAGIGTLPEFRRRGAASAVIDCLLRAFFGAGGEMAWLSAGDDGAKAAYARLGFRDFATQVCYSLSAEPG